MNDEVSRLSRLVRLYRAERDSHRDVLNRIANLLRVVHEDPKILAAVVALQDRTVGWPRHVSDATLAAIAAAVAEESRTRLGLRSLGDAVRSGRRFRRPCWGEAYACLEPYTILCDGQESHATRIVVHHGALLLRYDPNPEDTWALDYVLLPDDATTEETAP